MKTWSRRRFLTAASAVSFSGVVRAQRRTANAAYAAAAAYSADRRGVSLLVMRDGDILFEDYPRSGAVDRAWELASGTKSFTGIMAAAAQADGLLDIDRSCAAVLPEWAGDSRREITIRHLLSLTSGLDEVGQMARPPAYADAIEAAVAYPPGQQFQYGPTPFQIFGEMLRRRLAQAGEPADPVLWFKARVLDRIGAGYGDWKRGRDGNPYLPQGGHFTARHWARFGQWVQDGADGVDPAVVRDLFESGTANPGYGLSWWLLRPGLIGPSPRAGVDAETIGRAALDEDAVMAAGAGDQRLYLFRKRRLVVVRQADQIVRGMLQSRRADRRWSDGEFIRLLLAP
jgi:CubicO group peptidase (beta-lactamase class C family)